MSFLQEVRLSNFKISGEYAKMQKFTELLHNFQITLEKSAEMEYNNTVLLNIVLFHQRKERYIMAVELKTIQHLCELSKLNYDEAGLEKVMGEMSDIIDLMDTIKSFDLTYDDTKDNNSISLSDVREDVPQPSFPTEKLLANAENRDNCYVVPKVVE